MLLSAVRNHCKRVLEEAKFIYADATLQLSPVLAKLYNKCLFESCFPSSCKFSSVVPAYKNE